MSGATPARVLIATHAAMADHGAPGHPERAERLAPVVAGVEQGASAAGAELRHAEARPAGDEELARIHPAWYIAALEEAAAAGGGWLDADTYLGRGSVRAARLAAGATIDAALAVARGEAGVAFAVVRPPGHHAARERGSGFCLFNSIALAVAALRDAGLAQRIAIVDWDVHHGDGTQEIFDDDADLCYASTHQSPLYPGSGATGERGHGRAAGTKHNRPLPPGTGDKPFVATWRDELLPAIEAFRPQAILVSAGYDGHRSDPLAHLELTEDGYRSVAGMLAELLSRLGLPGVALTLEGGYDLEALRAATAATLEGLLGSPSGDRAR